MDTWLKPSGLEALEGLARALMTIQRIALLHKMLRAKKQLELESKK